MFTDIFTLPFTKYLWNRKRREKNDISMTARQTRHDYLIFNILITSYSKLVCRD